MQRNRKRETQELSQGNIIQRAVHQSLCELLISLISYFNFIYQQRMESLLTSHPQKNKRWKTLNWKSPGEAEYTCITETLKEQKELLKHEYREGKDTSLHELLIRLLRNLWKYVQLFNFRRMGESSSMYHQEEWTRFASQNKCDELDTFKQHVHKLLYFLKKAMAGWTTQGLDLSRYQEDDVLQEFSLCYTHQEL